MKSAQKFTFADGNKTQWRSFFQKVLRGAQGGCSFKRLIRGGAHSKGLICFESLSYKCCFFAYDFENFPGGAFIRGGAH